ncbi:MAG: acyl-CoA thioesterase [Cyclonatronaceae bacterium]
MMAYDSRKASSDKPAAHRLPMSVRDYELDVQGVVNNAVYQNYFEHARHSFLRHAGINFVELHRQQIDAVVHKIEIQYKKPLQADDDFVVCTRVRPQGGVRFIFEQEIERVGDGVITTTARVTAVFMSDKRPIRPPAGVMAAVAPYITPV